jgi:hypothetical protein
LINEAVVNGAGADHRPKLIAEMDLHFCTATVAALELTGFVGDLFGSV